MVEPLELDLLSLEAAKELLLASTPRRTKRVNEHETLTRLADGQLGCLSLALVQAAAYIDERRIGFADYSELFAKETGNLLAKLGESAIRNFSCPLPVALTWQASFAQLTAAGRLLLDMLSWLSIEPIPRSLFNVWPHAEVVDLDEALAELTRYSFVHWEGENNAITLHRLVSQVTRDSMDETRRDEALTSLFQWLAAVNPDTNASDVRCWPQLLPLLPHILLLFERAKDQGPYIGQAYVFREFSILLHALARYSEAEPLIRQALAIDQETHGSSHFLVASDLNNLAELLRDTDRLDEAEPLFRLAIETSQNNSGPNDPSASVSKNNLALLLQSTERMAEAEELLRSALETDEKAFGAENWKVAIRLSNLAGLMHANGRFDEADPLLRRALAINESHYGSNHPTLTFPLSHLAGGLMATSKFAEAEPLFRRVLEIDEASYGPEHPEVAADLNNLGGLLLETNRKVEAEALLRRATLILLQSSKMGGHLLPNTRPALSNYVVALFEMGREPQEIDAIVVELINSAGLDKAELWPPRSAGTH